MDINDNCGTVAINKKKIQEELLKEIFNSMMKYI